MFNYTSYFLWFSLDYCDHLQQCPRFTSPTINWIVISDSFDKMWNLMGQTTLDAVRLSFLRYPAMSFLQTWKQTVLPSRPVPLVLSKYWGRNPLNFSPATDGTRGRHREPMDFIHVPLSLRRRPNRGPNFGFGPGLSGIRGDFRTRRVYRTLGSQLALSLTMAFHCRNLPVLKPRLSIPCSVVALHRSAHHTLHFCWPFPMTTGAFEAPRSARASHFVKLPVGALSCWRTNLLWGWGDLPEGCVPAVPMLSWSRGCLSPTYLPQLTFWAIYIHQAALEAPKQVLFKSHLGLLSAAHSLSISGNLLNLEGRVPQIIARLVG